MIGSLLKAITGGSGYAGPASSDDRGGSMPLSGPMSPVTAGGGGQILSGSGSPVMGRFGSSGAGPADISQQAPGGFGQMPVAHTPDQAFGPLSQEAISEAVTGLLRKRQIESQALEAAQVPMEQPALGYEGGNEGVMPYEGDGEVPHINAPPVIVPMNNVGQRDWGTGEANLVNALRSAYGAVGNGKRSTYGRQ